MLIITCKLPFNICRYRNAGHEVIKVLSEFSPTVERASVDEAYIDLTEVVEARLAAGPSTSAPWDPVRALKAIDKDFLENNFVLGSNSTQEWLEGITCNEMTPIFDAKLAIGAEIVGQMRRAVFEKTGFRCSAGIAHNKVSK